MRSTPTEGEALVLHLQFPPEWRQARNPLAESAAAWARTLLADLGVTRAPGAERQLESLDLAGYGWPFPNADRHLLCTATAFLALWALYEKELETRREADEGGLITAIRGEGTRPPNPFHAVFWELGQRYGRKLGRNFASRHGERFRAWLRAVEAGGAGRAAAGVLPILDFLELDLGEELPASCGNDPRLGTVERLAAETLALQYDLGVFLREPDDRRPNAVRGLAEAPGSGAAEACAEAVRRHNELVRQLDRSGRALVVDQRSAPLTAWWIRLGGLVAGFGRRLADRARAPLQLGGRELRLTLGAAEEPAGPEDSSVTTAIFKVPQLFLLAAPLG